MYLLIFYISELYKRKSEIRYFTSGLKYYIDYLVTIRIIMYRFEICKVRPSGVQSFFLVSIIVYLFMSTLEVIEF